MTDQLRYTIIRSKRKTVAIQISATGEILVRCPTRMAVREIQKFVDSKCDWIHKHLEKITPLPPLTEQEHEALRACAKAVLPKKVAYFAGLLGVTYGSITVRTQQTRWGSCSGKGNLNFNCLLMLAPSEVQDYVVIHELCHRKEMNHSAKFWAEVEKIMPDYRVYRKWLRDNGPALISRYRD